MTPHPSVVGWMVRLAVSVVSTEFLTVFDEAPFVISTALFAKPAVLFEIRSDRRLLLPPFCPSIVTLFTAESKTMTAFILIGLSALNGAVPTIDELPFIAGWIVTGEFEFIPSAGTSTIG